jgi:hypothetical protein
MIIFVNRFSGG